ncbi:hypothetical protein [Paraburkholderia graminis]|jgi:hypothetical protein|nr:hypothetical protein [Paraburkholderia graminis]
MSQDKPTTQAPPFLARPLAVDPLYCGPRESLPLMEPEDCAIGG